MEEARADGRAADNRPEVERRLVIAEWRRFPQAIDRLELVVTKPEVQLMREMMEGALKEDANAVGVRVPILVKKDADFCSIDFAALYKQHLERADR